MVRVKLPSEWPTGVTRKDIKIQFFKSSGPGGQNKNKRDTACRMTHIPTGISTTATEERQQGQNKRMAWKKLCAKLVPLIKKEAKKERFLAGSERIRNYHEPDQRVTDSRLPGEQWTYDNIVNKDGLGKVVNLLAFSKSK